MNSTSENIERTILEHVNTFKESCARFEENLNHVEHFIEGSKVREGGDFSRFVRALERESRLMKISYAKIKKWKEKDCCLKKVACESAKKVKSFLLGKERFSPINLKENLSFQLKGVEAKSDLVKGCDSILKKLRKMEEDLESDDVDSPLPPSDETDEIK